MLPLSIRLHGFDQPQPIPLWADPQWWDNRHHWVSFSMLLPTFLLLNPRFWHHLLGKTALLLRTSLLIIWGKERMLIARCKFSWQIMDHAGGTGTYRRRAQIKASTVINFHLSTNSLLFIHSPTLHGDKADVLYIPNISSFSPFFSVAKSTCTYITSALCLICHIGGMAWHGMVLI